MHDILIRGMEMPKTCCQCDLKIYDPEKRWDENGIERISAWVCKITREIIWNTQRGDNCPLVSLPEGHGDLADKQAFIADIAGFIECMTKAGVVVDGEMLYGKLLDALDNAKTIVPAEGGTDDDGNA